ncbi:MAG TPA: hypothetical protein VL137_02860 [Polyangiaceae bacterium]|nr:hypothetical protein [Polyangiaceae bacterium]
MPTRSTDTGAKPAAAVLAELAQNLYFGTCFVGEVEQFEYGL